MTGRPRLCATVFERTTTRALEVASLAAARCDLLEFRLDPLADADPERLLAASPRPAIITCRGERADRVDLLRAAIRAGAAFVDAEPEDAARLGDRRGTKLILSRHDHEGTPDLDALLDRLLAEGPDLVKIVPTARGPEDVLAVLRLLRDRNDGRLCAHPMGAAGLPGRILAARYGSAIVYGAARAGAEAAPGQVPLRRLVDDYGLDRDLSGAAVLVLLGGSLAHSVSPRMMNRVFRARGIPALYVPFPVSDPGPLLAAMREFRFAGLAVTIPLKERVAALVDDLDSDAARTGAVNTVSLRDGRLTGHNTDLAGAMGALRTVLSEFAGLSAIVIGAGGAGRAVAHGLRAAGARIAVLDVEAAKAERLAAEVGGATTVEPAAADILVNCTPVGQAPATEESPVPAAWLHPGLVVMDAVYNPPETRLLREARAAGGRTVPGMEMLARQAARQVEIWLAASVDASDLRGEGYAALRRAGAPVVLIGMRGAGKSTVGRIMAERIGRPFTDLDTAIEARAGRPISRIFLEDGEARFRDLEFEALRDLLVAGRVLALGGGALDRPAARRVLADRGARAVFLDAPASILAARIRSSDRPALTDLPPDREVEALLCRRAPLYRAAAEVTVDAAASGPESVADRVLDALGY